jgi:hypothetical protein
MCPASMTIAAKINPTISRTTIRADTGNAENRSRRASATIASTNAQKPEKYMDISMKKKLCPVSSFKNAGGLMIQQKSSHAAKAMTKADTAQTGRRFGGVVFMGPF